MPSGQRSWRTSAKHLASSNSPERLTRSDAGMIVGCMKAAADHAAPIIRSEVSRDGYPLPCRSSPRKPTRAIPIRASRTACFSLRSGSIALHTIGFGLTIRQCSPELLRPPLQHEQVLLEKCTWDGLPVSLSKQLTIPLDGALVISRQPYSGPSLCQTAACCGSWIRQCTKLPLSVQVKSSMSLRVNRARQHVLAELTTSAPHQ